MTSLFQNKVQKTNNEISKTNILESAGYIILEHIAHGSYGEVRHAKFTDEENQLKLVVKIIDTNTSSKEYVTKFLPRELDVIRKINHPYIIHTHCIIQKKATLYVFMAYAEKGELLKYIMNFGPLTEKQSRIWFRQMLLAVQYLHTIDIVHRDIKCENILLTEHLTVKLTDFGFSKFVKRSKRLNCDTYCGSISYAAPEVLSTRPYDGKSSDIWSLGVVLFVMLNKKLPFNVKNVKLMYKQQVKRNWDNRPSIERLMSENLKICMYNILQPEPRKRWPIDKVLDCEWIKMNEKLIKMNEQESLALIEAQNISKTTNYEDYKKIEANRSETQQILDRQPLRFLSITQKMESISNPSKENSVTSNASKTNI